MVRRALAISTRCDWCVSVFLSSNHKRGWNARKSTRSVGRSLSLSAEAAARADVLRSLLVRFLQLHCDVLETHSLHEEVRRPLGPFRRLIGGRRRCAAHGLERSPVGRGLPVDPSRRLGGAPGYGRALADVRVCRVSCGPPPPPSLALAAATSYRCAEVSWAVRPRASRTGGRATDGAADRRAAVGGDAHGARATRGRELLGEGVQWHCVLHGLGRSDGVTRRAFGHEHVADADAVGHDERQETSAEALERWQQVARRTYLSTTAFVDPKHAKDGGVSLKYSGCSIRLMD